ncbi:hypothetical protein ACIQGZ_26115 [Streptomyces sp. NPDC092296]|uniref:hypothetical protein n=1 Tax=Streptomyces sp. NPDC092296 TaxID=3366012 RepID=UPI003804E099
MDHPAHEPGHSAAVLLPLDGGPARGRAVLWSTGHPADHAVHISTAVWHPERTGPFLDRHLRAAAHGPHPWPQLADVLVRVSDPTRMEEEPDRHPGALVVASVHRARHCTLRLATATPLTLDAAPVASAAAWLPWEVLASLVHGWLAAGLPPLALAPAVVQPLRPGAPGCPPERILLRRT